MLHFHTWKDPAEAAQATCHHQQRPQNFQGFPSTEFLQKSKNVLSHYPPLQHHWSHRRGKGTGQTIAKPLSGAQAASLHLAPDAARNESAGLRGTAAQ